MAEKWLEGVDAGAVDISVPVSLRLSASNLESTGVAHGSVTASYWRQGGARTNIPTSALTTITDAHADGGWKEVDSTNMPGIYRLDVPDAAFATGADWVVVTVKVSGSFVDSQKIPISTTGAAIADIQARLPAALVSGRIDASLGAMATDVVTGTAIATSAVDKLSAGLRDDTLAELAQAQPPATPTLEQAIMLLYMAMRNKLIDTPSLLSIHNDAGSVICKATLSEVANTSFTRDKLVAGP